MRSYMAYVQKEFTESLRTYKLVACVLVFLILGILSPLTAKLTPQILESLATEGMKITALEPTALDAWTQFFKNVSQIGFVVLVILYSNTMAHEFNRGTLVNILTKGMPRRTVILSKFTSMGLIWTVSYILCLGVSYGYTAYYWTIEGMEHLWYAIFCQWTFGMVLLAVVVLAGVLTKTAYGTLMGVGAYILSMVFVSMIPKFQHVTPLALTTQNMSFIRGDIEPEACYVAILVSYCMLALAMGIAIKCFNKKRL